MIGCGSIIVCGGGDGGEEKKKMVHFVSQSFISRSCDLGCCWLRSNECVVVVVVRVIGDG